jgi:hapalindole-type alkaloid chlorinase
VRLLRRRRPTSLGPWLEVDADELDGDLADAISSIYDGSLDGMTIRGVFAPDEVAEAVRRLERHREQFVDHGTVLMFGTAIVGSDDERSLYHRTAPAMTADLEELFPQGFASRIEQVLGRVGRGRPVRVPDDGPERTYVPATARILPASGGVIHGHTANEFCDVWPAYEHLRRTARMWNSLSYFITAQAPESGGGLMLYDLVWDDTPEDVLALAMSPERDELLSRFPGRVVQPGAGDMVLFTGGRIWHRVEPVQGTTPRITVGGFVAESADGAEVLYWS